MSALAPRPQYPTFQFDKPGAKADGIIICPPEDRQARKFGTDILDFWPDGNPIMETKIVLREDSGREYAVYAKGRMAKAITKAIVATGAPDLLVNGRLTVEFTHFGQGKNPAQPPKEFAAVYVSPSGPAVADDDEPPF